MHNKYKGHQAVLVLPHRSDGEIIRRIEVEWKIKQVLHQVMAYEVI